MEEDEAMCVLAKLREAKTRLHNEVHIVLGLIEQQGPAVAGMSIVSKSRTIVTLFEDEIDDLNVMVNNMKHINTIINSMVGGMVNYNIEPPTFKKKP
jgi:hypothetical protein